MKSSVQFIIVSSRYTTIALIILLTEGQYLRGIFFSSMKIGFSESLLLDVETPQTKTLHAPLHTLDPFLLLYSWLQMRI